MHAAAQLARERAVDGFVPVFDGCGHPLAQRSRVSTVFVCEYGVCLCCQLAPGICLRWQLGPGARVKPNRDKAFRSLVLLTGFSYDAY